MKSENDINRQLPCNEKAALRNNLRITTLRIISSLPFIIK